MSAAPEALQEFDVERPEESLLTRLWENFKGGNLGSAPVIFGLFLDHGHPRAVFIFIAACALVAVATVSFMFAGRRTAI